MIDFLPMITVQNGVPVTTSRAAADYFGKRHAHVIRAIEDIITGLSQPKIGLADGQEFNRLNFEPTSYKDEQGKPRKQYNMTRDGFTLLAMGFTGEKALAFKVAYINAFNEMERLIKGGSVPQPVKRESPEIAACNSFLKAIAAALDSGDYYIVPNTYGEHKTSVKPPERAGVFLGAYNDVSIRLYTKLAYEAYTKYTDKPISLPALRDLLLKAGLIKASGINKKTYYSISPMPRGLALFVYRDKAAMLERFTNSALLTA